MDRLYEISGNLIERTKLSFFRYLYNVIDWDWRMIGISGARGSGKTTLMLQYIKERIKPRKNVIYISLDDPYFLENSLLDFTDSFYKSGGKYIFIDEVHKYKNWSSELKNIYDYYPELKIVFSGSSALAIYNGEADLSRRAIVYNLNELSFREYLHISEKIQLPSFHLEEILHDHQEIVASLLTKVKPLEFFPQYLKFGLYPFIAEGSKYYLPRLGKALNQVIETDLPAIENINYTTVQNLKRLMYILAISVPFKPNISELSAKLGLSRERLLRHLDLLNRARIIHLLKPQNKAHAILSKPEKIFLNNPSLHFALNETVYQTGTLRETFFYNQLNATHQVNYSLFGDFLVDNKYVFEVGGKSKTKKQIKGIEQGFLIKDGVEIGHSNTIPLWLFGFLY